MVMATNPRRDKGKFYSRSKEDIELILMRQAALEDSIRKLLEAHQQQIKINNDLLLQVCARTQEEVKLLKGQFPKIAKVLLDAIINRQPQSIQEMIERDTRREHQSPYIPHEEQT
jgi:hypothetical protein